MTEDLIKIGQITSAHGIHGQVKVFPLTDFPERFQSLTSVLLGPEARPVQIRMQGTLRNLIILEIHGVNDRDAAETLRQQYLMVPRSEIWPLPEGNYYVFDMLGLAVTDPEGNPLGTLVQVDKSSPVHDLYVIETAAGKRHMVPAVRQFVKSIDMERGVMVIQPIPGLLEE